MPRDASGNYTPAVGNPVSPGTTIEANWANTTIDDISTALTESLDRYGRGDMQAPLVAQNGAVSAPGIQFASAADAGLFSSSAGIINFVSGGAIKGYFDSAGGHFQNLLEILNVATAPPTLQFTDANAAADLQKYVSFTTASQQISSAQNDDDSLPTTKGQIRHYLSDGSVVVDVPTTPLNPVGPGSINATTLWENGKRVHSPNNPQATTIPGEIRMWGGTTAPTGWLLCDGSVVSQTTYAALYAVIGAFYNTGGEGADNFRLPNFDGRAPIGVGNALGSVPWTLGQQGGGESITLAAANIPPHVHQFDGNNVIAAPGTNNLDSLGGGSGWGVITQTGSGVGLSADPFSPYSPKLCVNFIIAT